MAGKESTIEQQYQSLAPALDRLKTECGYIIEDALRQASIKTHSVLSRVKTLESAKDKISRREKAQSSLDEIDDLLGLRIVCLLRSDIQRIGEIIRSEFEVIAEDNKLDGANIEAFGYQSVHFIAKLDVSCTGRRYSGLHDQIIEIQLRTVAMDAWATLSHYLDYKNEADVPKALRKDFFALSGLFYLADTHFEFFYDARKQSGLSARTRVESTELEESAEINYDTLSAYLRKKFPERNPGEPSTVSQLLQELIEFNCADFEKIDKIIAAASQKFAAYEEAVSIDEDRENESFFFSDVGAIRSSLALVNDNYYRRKKFDANPTLREIREK